MSRTPITASSLAASASDSLRELEASRREKIETGEYREAGGLQKKIEKLKLSEDKRFRQELETKHRDQLQELKKKQDDEQAAFELKWQETFDRLKNEAKETENAMKKKHEEETVKSKDINPGGASTMSPKWSSKLLDLRKSEESLLRMHEFIKAAKVKDAADLLEEKELKAILEKNKNLGKAEAAQLSHQQKLEMDVLRQRHKTAKDEATVTLKKEVEILSKKFKVERQEMDKMHSLEKTDLEEAIKGWYNLDRGLGLAPSILVPTLVESVELMSPQSLILNRRGSGVAGDEKSRPGSPKKSGGDEKSRPGSPKKSGGDEVKLEEGGAAEAAKQDKAENSEAGETTSSVAAPAATEVVEEKKAAQAESSEKAVVPKALQPKSKSVGGSSSPYTSKSPRTEVPTKKKSTTGGAPASAPPPPSTEVIAT